MSNKYCQALVELRNKPAHELKEVGDQWRTPDNIFWGINTLFGPFVLDLFTDGDNAKCAAYYTAEDNALAHDWSERLAELKGAAFGNPPYSRASQHEGQYITGMRYIMKHATAMRDKGGRYVFLIKAATSEVWWPEDADHIAFIRGRIGFELPAWFIPKDEKQVPTGAFFAGAIAVFDKTWKGPAISYIGRDELEACGEAFLAGSPAGGKTGQGDGGMKLILPFPPSVNTYWRHPNKGAFAGKSLISAAGRKFQSAACAAIVEQLRRLPKPTSAPASVEIVLFPPDNRIRDLDNYNKALFDALTHAGVWEDDSQVKRMLVEWGPVIPEGKVEITISKYEKASCKLATR